MRFNDRDMAVQALYNLFLVCSMLRKHYCDSGIGGSSHNYPRIILSYLLFLEHWRANDLVPYRIMKHHMHMFNEELGEISLSMLSRCVLGDS